MRIEHIALWTGDLEKLKEFYIRYFNAVPNTKYENKEKGFSSYFLTFKSGTRLELMTLTHKIHDKKPARSGETAGFAHCAFAVESREHVDTLARKFKNDGYIVTSGPRVTGDGYYECAVLDPDGNTIEITAL